MKKGLAALAFGTLALGMMEFLMMGILPDVARGLNVSIAETGHLISAYALGVTCGAPLLTVVNKFSPKSILLFLAVLILVGATLCSFAPNYPVLLVARFIAGLPHGAYFGVASIAAVRLADENHKTGAVSIMIAGMTVANLFGIPLGTSLSAHLSWRAPFMLVIFISLLVIYYIWRWVPYIKPNPAKNFRNQFAFLKKPEPWLILGSTMFANGGIFCWYSYVTPLLTEESGFAADVVPVLMILAGFGMVVGNLVSGKMADRFGSARVAVCVEIVAIAALVLIFYLSGFRWVTALLMMVCTASLFAVSSPQQFLILKYAPGGEMLGGALIQMAFNMGNAVGAYVGGLSVDAGYAYHYTAVIGAGVVALGLMCMETFRRRTKKETGGA